MQKPLAMLLPPTKVRVLAIRPWTRKLDRVRASLRAEGLEPRFLRVDIEPALNAALTRGDFDVALVDPDVPGLPAKVIEEAFRTHRVGMPWLVLEDEDGIGPLVVRALASIRN